MDIEGMNACHNTSRTSHPNSTEHKAMSRFSSEIEVFLGLSSQELYSQEEIQNIIDIY